MGFPHFLRFLHIDRTDDHGCYGYAKSTCKGGGECQFTFIMASNDSEFAQ